MISIPPPIRTRVRVRGLAGALGLMLASAVAATAQDPKPLAARPADKPDDPKALALLGEIAKAYQGLGSYNDQGRFVVSMTVNGKSQNQEAPLKLALARPNKLSLDAGPVKLLSDGATMTTVVEPMKKYISVPAPKAINLEVFRDGPVGAILFGGPSGVPMYVLANMLTAPDPVKAVDQLGGSIQLEGENALIIDQADGPDLKLTVDPKTKLFSEIDLIVDPKLLEKNAAQGNAVKVEKLGWSSGPVSIQPADAGLFAFKAPEGFTKVDSFQQPGEPGGEQPKMAVESKVGKPAPDFALTLFDGPDKTKVVSKADLAGKVVVIDFWATWCPPCLAELPEIQKLVAELKDKKDVLVVALSQDSQPADPIEVRKLIEKTLTEKKIELTGANVAIGLDPSGTVGGLFEVEGLPTLVILDGKGLVQAAHVGFDPDMRPGLREKLTSEIESLLAGKPLVKPEKPQEAAAKPEPKP